jgi:RNA polymerase-binding transcription factor DksA
MSDLGNIREQLQAELDQVIEKHGSLSDHLRNEDRTVPADWTDQAQSLENDEVMGALETRARERIETLTQALARIESGNYVTCSSCGNGIEAERLEVLPETTVCATCAKL